MTTYITGDEINTTTVEWIGRSCKIAVTLLRNAALTGNGWIPCATHSLQIRAGDHLMAFDSESIDAEGNYCIKVSMGRVTITIPTEYRAAVQGLLADRQAHNAACNTATDNADRADNTRRAAVQAMMTR